MTSRPPLPEERRRPLSARVPADPATRAAIVAAHERACADGQAGYLDPVSGLFVFTATHHWDRGRCCENGCRHCPYATGERT